MTAICEDYRAGATIDRALDAVEGASHFLVEDAPADVAADLAGLFA